MSRLLAVPVFLLVACNKDGDELPIGPGGGGQGGSTNPDAAVDPDGGAQITGRVCLLSDPRSPTSCATTGADGLMVFLGTYSATTASNGAFSITRPTGSNLVWSVDGNTVEPTVMSFGTSTTIPSLSSALYADMLSGMNATVLGGNGAMIVQLVRAGSPVAGATVVASPAPDSEVYYDGIGVTDWDFDSTGPFGVVWISSIPTGTATVTITQANNTQSTLTLPVFSDAITFATAEIP